MLQLSELAKREKNKISSDGVWLVLLEVQFEEEPLFHIVLNNENIVWNNNEYIAFPFELGKITQTSEKELPTLDIKVCNVDRTVQAYLEEYSGGKDTTVILRVVNSKFLTETTPVFEEIFSVLSTKADAMWVTFNVGCDYSFYQRFPRHRYKKNICYWKYKGIECACTSTLTTCNGTLASCRERGNSVRFGGQPGIYSNSYS